MVELKIDDFKNEFLGERVIHKKFKVTTEGYEWDSFPMRLFRIGEKLAWNPYDIDFSQDVIDWQTRMKPADKLSILGISSLFSAGEECVARDIIPMIYAVEELGLIEETLYLTQFARDEAVHAIAFRRWFESVGETKNIHHLTVQNEPYKKLIYEIIPTDMRRLYKDSSPENIIKAAISYNLIVEGTAAETGYYTYGKMYEIYPALPGLVKMTRLIARDEARHISYGTYIIALMVSMYGEEMFEVFSKYFSSLSNLIIDLINSQVKFLTSKNWGEHDKGPIYNYFTSEEGINELLSYAQKMFQIRYNVIQKAIKMEPKDVRKLKLSEIGIDEE